MRPNSWEEWGCNLTPPMLPVDCLLPTGITVLMTCKRDATLEKLKTDLWIASKNYPLHRLLLCPESYIFVGITQDAEREEFYDETRRLCDLRLFQATLKVMERVGNGEEKMLNYEIGMVIGKPVNEFNEMKDLEVMTFRRKILGVCKETIDKREKDTGLSRVLYAYPPDIEASPVLPPHLTEKLQKSENSLIICIWVVKSDGNRNKYSMKVSHNASPTDVIAEAIRHRSHIMNVSKEHSEKYVDGYRHTYVLKVCGCDQFLLADCPISQYKPIRECIANEKIPQLMLLLKESVFDSLHKNEFFLPSYSVRGIQALNEINNQQTVSLWDVQTMMGIKVTCATNVLVKDLGKIYVKACVYHGTEPLCEARNTQQVDSTNPRWDQWLEFLPIPDIPRSARLCLSICSVSKRKNKKDSLALAWGNLQMFDFNDRLLSEKISLHLWPMPQGMDDLVNPIGSPGSSQDKDCPCLEIEFIKFSHPVQYPSESHLEQLANHITDRDKYSEIDTKQELERDRKMLEDIISKDPLSDLSEQDKDLLWNRRELCLKLPQSLPKLLCSVKWNNRENVAQLYVLLRRWPSVLPEVALELLDCSYSDLRVRQFAVECLDRGLHDDELSQYLLQLVQALKYEPYLDNPLTTFLLKRALLSQRIGNFFFWHLKSEMHHTSSRLRFGLVLEAYCRGCGSFLKKLSQQVEALEKLTRLTIMLKSVVKDDEQMKFLQEQLQQPDYQEALKRIISPLNTAHILGEIIQADCAVMTSKKRPLWLVWSNPDPMKDMHQFDYRVIFKNGDDLRQDMLTLQVIRLMDTIWKAEGLDLRMIPYACLATGKDVGLIQVVRNAKTITSIQSGGGARATIQMDSSQLHRWIKEKNADRYDQAIDAFTRSCAGYCVATFVLGIGDRHPGNIMVTEEGQVFHIDFGHFLNHRKKKFGINRERVPFVLTEDFLRVIAKGADQPSKQKEYERFQELCVSAFVVLRENKRLLITLFSLMLSCGIPELQSLDDIEYIRKTLSVEKTEKEAVKYFIEQLQKAYGGQWTTKVDWLCHNVKGLW
ncbi:phosphatidylinositol 4,5-bisphosphate 3-kinase catalytic subunit alpha isoform-like [Haliotis rufescens]|uniref:phosphatidylinositol 4,5-bisphosphate 3-kinase catalytic subunit alpha isoform-like n=1 Tax=Haliotis rufescens TaxID=6454 RepID=UPI00201EAB17|nr:phosphatidylinositol 4,5-bisphosphate 3-kinase catalytic subunit alpha isoform-like [Haliotis rufescens]